MGKSKIIKALCEYVDNHIQELTNVLEETTEIPSISSNPDNRDDCIRMVKWATCKLKSLGFRVEQLDMPPETFPDGKIVRGIPIMLASLGTDSSKPTICYTGSLDCSGQPDLNCSLGKTLCWLMALHVYLALGLPLPVNVKLVLGSGSDRTSFLNLLSERKGSFFADVIAICSSPHFWPASNTPALSYGGLGISVFHVKVSRASRQHRNGTVLNECINDITYMLDGLVQNGKIVIPNINKDIIPMSNEIKEMFSRVRLNVYNYEKQLNLNYIDKENLLLRQWGSPFLKINEIFTSPNPSNRSITPKSVYAEFSIRSPPCQNPQVIKQLVIDFMKEKWRKRQSTNKFKIHMAVGDEPWITDYKSKVFVAAMNASKLVYGVKPILTMEGGSYWRAAKLQGILEKEVILMPLGPSEPQVGEEEQDLDKRQIMGIKYICVFLFHLPLALEGKEGECH